MHCPIHPSCKRVPFLSFIASLLLLLPGCSPRESVSAHVDEIIPSPRQTALAVSFFEAQSSWIGTFDKSSPEEGGSYPAPYFRKEVNLASSPCEALIHICGLGFYELYINGKKVGDKVLTPPITNYDTRPLHKLLYHYDDQSTQRYLFDSYDITPYLHKGANAIGIILGNGWYNLTDRTVEGTLWYDTPRVAALMKVSFGGGKKGDLTLQTDSTWKFSKGALLHDGIFSGEIYDATLEHEGWTMAGFDDSKWQNAPFVRRPSGKAMPSAAPPDRITGTLRPTLDSVSKGGRYHFSIPHTISGWLRLQDIKAERGDTIRLRFISEEGLSYGQADTYICRGTPGGESWSPRFTWHAFRRVEIDSPVPLSSDNVLAQEVRTDVPVVGSFKCSDTLLNRIHDAYILTQNANMHGSVSSDCPHRERAAYTGDALCGSIVMPFVYDSDEFYRKWLDDMEDARNHVTGYVPHTAPFAGGGGGPAWGSAMVLLPYFHYLHYGEVSILSEHYDAMKGWVEYLGTRTDERGIIVREEPRGWCLGDWCTPERVQIPESLVNTCFYYRCATVLSTVASILGKGEDSSRYSELAKGIKDSFNEAFLDSERGCYWEGRQGADAFPLAFGMVPEEMRKRVEEHLLTHTRECGYHFDTGIHGTPLTLDALTKAGHADVALQMLRRRDFPSFGYLLDPANTNLWERWDGEESHSHPMFGSVVGWMYRTLGGINLEKADWERGEMTLTPHFLPGISFVDCSYMTPYGKVTIQWDRKSERDKPSVKVSAPKGLKVKVEEVLS